MQFQVLTLVRLRAPEISPPDTPEDDQIQAAHMVYLAGLAKEGKILVNGPIKRLDDPKFLGLSVYTVGVDEARALAMQDPAYKAGWIEPHVDTWLVPYGPKTIGDRVDLDTERAGS